MNLNLEKISGIASLVMAATFLFGMVVFFTLLEPAGFLDTTIDPGERVAFIIDNQAVVSLWYLIIYVVFGALLVVLAVALRERLAASSSAATQVATIFGLIWAGLMFASGMVASVGVSTAVSLYAQDPSQAGALWLAVNTVLTGLGGGNEIVGGLWILLVSWLALQTAGALPKGAAYAGILVGAAGIVQTLAAEVEVLGAIFGLGMIVWFVWVGIFLLRTP